MDICNIMRLYIEIEMCIICYEHTRAMLRIFIINTNKRGKSCELVIQQ